MIELGSTDRIIPTRILPQQVKPILGSLAPGKACESTEKACFRTFPLAGLQLGKKLEYVLPCIKGAFAVCIRQPARGLEILGHRVKDEG